MLVLKEEVAIVPLSELKTLHLVVMVGICELEHFGKVVRAEEEEYLLCAEMRRDRLLFTMLDYHHP